MTKALFVSFVLAVLGLASGCAKRNVIDGSSEERFWISKRDLSASLSQEDGTAFEFAIVKLRKRGYTEDELARLSQAPTDKRFLSAVDGKTAREIIELAKQLPDEAPSAPVKK